MEQEWRYIKAEHAKEQVRIMMSYIATVHQCMLHECKGDCTLADYYLDEPKAAPSVLKYITNSKLILTSKDGGMHIKSSKYTAVFTGRDGSHHTGVAVCAGRGMVCQKLTLSIPVENPMYAATLHPAGAPVCRLGPICPSQPTAVLLPAPAAQTQYYFPRNSTPASRLPQVAPALPPPHQTTSMLPLPWPRVHPHPALHTCC